MTGERQATRIRSLYLKSVLKQDMTFFDVETTTGQVVSSISSDTTLIQDAIGDTPANGAGLDGFFGWVLIRVLLDGWKRVTL